MSPEHKERIQLWITALRSGNYQQGRGRLKTEDGYCCLGVACDVYLKASSIPDIENWWSRNSFLTLPGEVRDWFGLPDNNPVLRNDTGCLETCLALNDSCRKTFEEIAGYLERMLESGSMDLMEEWKALKYHARQEQHF